MIEERELWFLLKPCEGFRLPVGLKAMDVGTGAAAMQPRLKREKGVEEGLHKALSVTLSAAKSPGIPHSANSAQNDDPD